MVRQVERKRISLEQFLRRRETKPATEFERGLTHTKPPPTLLHGVMQSHLSYQFTLYIEEHPVADGGPNITCVFGPPDDVRVYTPDFVAMLKPYRFRNDCIRQAPDFIAEVITHDDRLMRVQRKVRFCLQNGTRMAWVIDPGSRVVMVQEDLKSARFVSDDEYLDGGMTFPGMRIDVRNLFPDFRRWASAADDEAPDHR